MPSKERSDFLGPLVLTSVQEAVALNQTLALVRPEKSKFTYKKKKLEKLQKEKLEYERAAAQTSFFDEELKALNPCPYEFKFKFTDAGGDHEHVCDDWETSAMFYNLCKNYNDLPLLSGPVSMLVHGRFVRQAGRPA